MPIKMICIKNLKNYTYYRILGLIFDNSHSARIFHSDRLITSIVTLDLLLLIYT